MIARMGTEIERKFLVHGQDWRNGARPVRCAQGYILAGPEMTVRVRIMGDAAALNLKKSRSAAVNTEFEYPIPVPDAEAILEEFCGNQRIEKTRHYVEFEGRRWEIDEFHGANAPLVVAEIELESEDAPFARPRWLAAEVTHDHRYKNSYLSRHPFAAW